MTAEEEKDLSTAERSRWNNLKLTADIAKKKLRALLSRMPILGHLVECKAEDHKASFNEVFYNLLFATMPFWLGASLALVFQPVDKVAGRTYDLSVFKDLLVGTVSHGQLFVFSTSILAPVMFMILQDPKGSKEFPSKLSIGFLTVLTMIFCAAFFSALQVKSETNVEPIVLLSSCLAVLALALRYLATVYHKYRQASPEEFKRGEKDFADELMAHR